MYINEASLQFGSLSNRPYTNYVVLHHLEARNWTVEDIHRCHKEEKGWSGIGYHFYIRKNGEVWRGRPEWAQGAHCPGRNLDGIGVSFEGNFMEDYLSQEQINSGNELITYLNNKYGKLTIGGHGDYYPTDCPGKNFDISKFTGETSSPSVSIPSLETGFRQRTQWLQILCNQLGVKDSEGNSVDQDGIMGPRTESAIRKLPYLGIPYVNRLATKHIQRLLGLTDDGIFGSNTKQAVMNWQSQHGLSADGIIGPDTWMSFS